LKKRSKKLLVLEGFCSSPAKARRSKSFFASFFSKKEVPSSFAADRAELGCFVGFASSQ
jgi:hypothetical protein